MNGTGDWREAFLARCLRRRARLPAKPSCASASGWQAWKTAEKRQAPFLHWFLEDFLDRLQRFVFWPAAKFDEMRAYLENRFVYQTHLLPTGVRPGEWRNLAYRMLHANMRALVDYVETDLALMQCDGHRSTSQATYGVKPHWYRSFRCPRAGLDWLAWEVTLDQPGIVPQSPRQAELARETQAIYRWWTTARPARPDSMAVTGLSAIYAAQGETGEDIFDDHWRTPEWERALRESREIDARYEEEDEAMLIRLVKIRKGLAT